jgi:hypothetical protein
LRRVLGERARTHARHYDWTNVAPQWARMYEDIMGRPHRPGTVQDAA